MEAAENCNHHAPKAVSARSHLPPVHTWQCCKSQQIHLCEKPWVGCREVAYELSHALNVCRGRAEVGRAKAGATTRGENQQS